MRALYYLHKLVERARLLGKNLSKLSNIKRNKLNKTFNRETTLLNEMYVYKNLSQFNETLSLIQYKKPLLQKDRIVRINFL